MNNSKQLFLVATYATNEDGVVVEVNKPEWIVETSLDRAKAKALCELLKDEDLDWNVHVINSINF